MQSQPESFIPKSPAQFIGGAHAVAKVLAGKAKRLRLHTVDPRAKVLLYGPPGTGKTKLAEMFAAMLTEHATQIEHTNGRNVDLELVRQWQSADLYVPLFGHFTVKIVDELDTCPGHAQDLLLTYLDKMPPFTVFIGTSNMQLNQLAERFQTRLQQFKVEAPATNELNRLLARWPIGDKYVKHIAVSSGGNVRAALLDTQTILDAKGS
jgi:replication-associated recombination protein RarA